MNMFLSVESNCFDERNKWLSTIFRKFGIIVPGLLFKKFLCSPFAEHGFPLACGCPLCKMF
jgi:hypothetical protein